MKATNTTSVYRLAFPSTRKEVESEYPSMSAKAKRLLTALRVKRQRRESAPQGVDYKHA